MCRDQNIEVADRRTTFGENGPDSPELKGGILSEVDDFESGRERIDKAMQSCGLREPLRSAPNRSSARVIALMHRSDGLWAVMRPATWPSPRKA